MKLIDCISALKGFEALAAQRLPLGASYYVASNIKKLKEIVDLFETTRLETIRQINESSDTDDAGNPIIPEEVTEKFRVDMEALLQEKKSIRLKKVDLTGSNDLQIAPDLLVGCIDYLKFTEHAS